MNTIIIFIFTGVINVTESDNKTVNASEDISAGKYGTYGLMKSDRRNATFVDISQIETANEYDGRNVWVRARVHTTRGKGKIKVAGYMPYTELITNY